MLCKLIREKNTESRKDSLHRETQTQNTQTQLSRILSDGYKLECNGTGKQAE